MIYIPIFGALSLAGGTILQRFILRMKKMDIKTYHVLEFFAIVVAMLPLIYFFWRLDSPAWQLKNVFIFGLVIVFSIIANLFVFYSMKWEKVSNLEPAKILEPLFVILLALVFSFFLEGYERNFKVLIPALIAGGALVATRIEKEHLKFNKYFLAAIAGSFFFAFELVISKLILSFYSPITFYFLRCSSILAITFILFRPKFEMLAKNKKPLYLVLATGAIWVAYRVIVYYGYLEYGIIFTTLMIMLGPILIYTFAWKFLKEKVKLKNIIAALVIVACIIYVLLD